MIPRPEVICGRDYNESDEGREKIEKCVAAVVILELLAGHFVAALGTPFCFFSTAALPPSEPMRLDLTAPLASQLASRESSPMHRCTWCTHAQCGLSSSIEFPAALSFDCPLAVEIRPENGWMEVQTLSTKLENHGKLFYLHHFLFLIVEYRFRAYHLVCIC